MPDVVDLATVETFARIATENVVFIAVVWVWLLFFRYFYTRLPVERVIATLTTALIAVSAWFNRTIHRPFRSVVTTLFGSAPDSRDAWDVPVTDWRAWLALISLVIVTPILEEVVFRALPIMVAEWTGLSPVGLVLVGTAVWALSRGRSRVVGELPLGLLFAVLWLFGQGWLAIALRVVPTVALMLVVYMSRVDEALPSVRRRIGVER